MTGSDMKLKQFIIHEPANRSFSEKNESVQVGGKTRSGFPVGYTGLCYCCLLLTANPPEWPCPSALKPGHVRRKLRSHSFRQIGLIFNHGISWKLTSYMNFKGVQYYKELCKSKRYL